MNTKASMMKTKHGAKGKSGRIISLLLLISLMTSMIQPALPVLAAVTDGVKNAYINGSKTAQNGSADNYQKVSLNDTITYEIKFNKWDPSALPKRVPNPTFDTTKLPKPKEVDFKNGSFEQPQVNPAVSFHHQKDVPGWSTRPTKTINNNNPDADMIEIQKVGVYDLFQHEFAPKAPNGTQYAELNAHLEGTLFQVVNTVPGTKIYYEFYHGARMHLVTGNKDIMNFYLRKKGVTSGGLQLVCTDYANQEPRNSYKWGHYTGVYTVPAGQLETEFAFE